LHAGAGELSGDEFIILAKRPEHVSRVFERLFVGRDPDPARYKMIRIEAPRREKGEVTT
jgi:hypothetical protein